MAEDVRKPARRKSRGGGRAAKAAERRRETADRAPYIQRRLGTFNVLGEEGLALIEHNADLLLRDVGMEFRDDPEILDILRDAGADVKGERVRFEPGMCRGDRSRQPPRASFKQHARNPANSIMSSAATTRF